MIPKTLQITNFFSYRDTAEIDFAGLHLACIAGMNGAGKSTILDAMTWALFGKSRSKSDDDVVNRIAARHGDTAEVILDFELENNLYRVLRRKKQRRTMVVEFQIQTETGEWKTLTEPKRRETDQAIVDLLRMSYDTFCNASFLLQGQADEFTTKTPGKRKEVLADLLGVNEWDKLRETAGERRRMQENQLTIQNGLVDDIDRELAEEPARQAAYEEAKAKHKLIQEKLRAQEEDLRHGRRQADTIAQQEKTVQTAAENLAREEKRLVDVQANRREKVTERAQHQEILDNAAQIKADYEAWQAAKTAVDDHQQRANQHNRLDKLMQPLRDAITAEKSRLQQQKETLLTQQQRTAAMREEHKTLTEQSAVVEKKLADLNEQLKTLAEVEKEHDEAREQLRQAKSAQRERTREREQLQKEAERIAQQRKQLAQLEKQQQETAAQLESLTAELKALDAAVETLNQQQNELSRLNGQQPVLRVQMDKLKERMDALDGQDECPVCEQPLTAEHRHTVTENLQQQGTEMAARFRSNRTDIPVLEKEIARLEKQVKQQPRRRRERDGLQQKEAQLAAQITEMKRAIDSWEKEGAPQLDKLAQTMETAAAEIEKQQTAVDKLSQKLTDKSDLEDRRLSAQNERSRTEARLEEIDKAVREWEETGREQLAQAVARLDENRLLPEKQAELGELEKEQAEVGYDAAAHEAAIKQRDKLKEAPARHQAWDKAKSAVEMQNKAIAELDERLAELEADIERLRAQHEEAAERLKALTADGRVDLKKLETDVQALREEEIQANRRVGHAEQNLQILDKQRTRKKEITEKKTEISRYIQRLRMLEKACGRDGVQALLIERSLPEIEEAANRLLDRLTDGQMRVMFNTQRELKSQKGQTTETLDIAIADTAGERPYENYSGGEQFRVNFAIRIALSQLLAKRAGARLQTLVVDEGFGSQDPTGRQRLVEAINTIQDDFKRILVITHIAELRDAFPNRIDVTKTATGSQVSIV